MASTDKDSIVPDVPVPTSVIASISTPTPASVPAPAPVVAEPPSVPESVEDPTTLDKIKAFLEKNKPIIGAMAFIMAFLLSLLLLITSCRVRVLTHKQEKTSCDVKALTEKYDPLATDVQSMIAKSEELNGILEKLQEGDKKILEALDLAKEQNGKDAKEVKTELMARIVNLEKEVGNLKGSPVKVVKPKSSAVTKDSVKAKPTAKVVKKERGFFSKILPWNWFRKD